MIELTIKEQMNLKGGQEYIVYDETTRETFTYDSKEAALRKFTYIERHTDDIVVAIGWDINS